MIETRRLKNLVIFFQTIFNFMLSRKVNCTFPVVFLITIKSISITVKNFVCDVLMFLSLYATFAQRVTMLPG